MRKTIVITDLTKMWGERVCIAGIDRQFQCVRPVLPGGVWRRHLYVKDTLVIRPRAKVRFDFHPVSIAPPHIEDLGFDPASVSSEGVCKDKEWEQVLQASSFRTVQDVYDGLLQENRWIHPAPIPGPWAQCLTCR